MLRTLGKLILISFLLTLTHCKDEANVDSETETAPSVQDPTSPDNDSSPTTPSDPGGFTLLNGVLDEGKNFAKSIELDNGHVFIFGGQEQTGFNLRSGIVYNPNSEAQVRIGQAQFNYLWPELNRLPSGEILIFGGAGVNNSFTNFTDEAEIFDPSDGSYRSTSGDMNETRGGATSVALNDGRIFIAGGHRNCSSANAHHRSAEIFDPSNESFSSVAAQMSGDRYKPSSVLLNDGRVMISGGSRCNFSALFGWESQRTNTIEIFNPTTNSFSNAGNLQFTRNDHKSFLLSDGRVFIFGGTGSNSDSMEIYDPQTQTSQSLGTTGINSRGEVASLGNDEFLIMIQDNAYIYTVGSGMGAAIPMNKNRIKGRVIGLSNGEVLVYGGGNDPDSREIEAHTP